MQRSHKLVLGGLATTVIAAGAFTAYVVYDKNHAVIEETRSVFSNTDGEPAYTDLLGNTISLEQYLGKILVVVSWASWSPFSSTDLGMLEALASELNTDEVVFLAINRKETKEQAERFILTQPKYDHLKMVLDPRDHFYTAVGGYAMPEAMVYNRRGEVLLHDRGIANKDTIKSVVEEELAKD